jgi:hypothetical protein
MVCLIFAVTVMVQDERMPMIENRFDSLEGIISTGIIFMT